MEFHGIGDPFFGGKADDRTLLADGQFGTYSPGGPLRALFNTNDQATSAGLNSKNRRPKGLLAAVPWHDSAD